MKLKEFFSLLRILSSICFSLMFICFLFYVRVLRDTPVISVNFPIQSSIILSYLFIMLFYYVIIFLMMFQFIIFNYLSLYNKRSISMSNINLKKYIEFVKNFFYNIFYNFYEYLIRYEPKFQTIVAKMSLQFYSHIRLDRVDKLRNLILIYLYASKLFILFVLVYEIFNKEIKFVFVFFPLALIIPVVKIILFCLKDFFTILSKNYSIYVPTKEFSVLEYEDKAYYILSNDTSTLPELSMHYLILLLYVYRCQYLSDQINKHEFFLMFISISIFIFLLIYVLNLHFKN